MACQYACYLSQRELQNKNESRLRLSDEFAVCDPVSEYVPRNPADTVLYNVVAENIESFLARQQERGRVVPRFVERELRGFLDCGVLARDFVRVHCMFAAWTASLLIPASIGAFALRVAADAWLRRPRISSTMCFPKFRSDSGCCRFPSTFAIVLPMIVL